MADLAVTQLLEAVKACATRAMGPYGACYCREPYPNEHLGHEHRCKVLAQAIRAVEATHDR